MALKDSQKKYIKKNIHRLPLSQIAANLNLEKKHILGYLKKKWRKGKYEKFIKKNKNGKRGDFELKIFFQKNRLILIALALLVFIVYFNSLNNDFVSDDIAGIAQNEKIGSFKNIFIPTFLGGAQRFVYFISFHIGEFNPAFYRIFNVIFHAGSVLVIFTLLNIISKKRIAVIASLLFAVHPILTESVTWISGMPYTLSALAFLLSFLLYVLAKNNLSDKKTLCVSYFLFFLALVSSEKIIPLFLIFLLFELFFGNLKKNWKKIIPYFILSFFWSILFLTKISGRIDDLKTDYYQVPSENNIFIQIPIAIISYLKLIFWPQKLSLYHTEMVFSAGAYFLMLIIFLAFLGAFVFAYKRNKVIFFWLAFFLIALLPTLSPLGVSWIVAERYAYLGSLGIFVITAIGIDWLIKKSEKHKKIYKQIICGVFAGIIIILSIRTVIRNNDWQNQDTFWIATAKTSPSGANIHNNLGDVHSRRGDHKEAIEEFRKAIEINPNYADAYHNLANTYQEIGQIDLAVENYKKAAELNPRLWQSYQNLAGIYFNQGDYQKALDCIQKAVEINPKNENLKQNLTVIKKRVPL